MLKEKIEIVKNETKEFCQKHTRGLGFSIGVASTIVGFFAVILKAKEDSSVDNLKYSDKFFRDASDDELAIEREKVRLKRNVSYDDAEYDKYYNLLNKFDNVISKRAFGDKVTKAPSYHSEHGRYLSEDDD